jgi:hypothetical protein
VLVGIETQGGSGLERLETPAQWVIGDGAPDHDRVTLE